MNTVMPLKNMTRFTAEAVQASSGVMHILNTLRRHGFRALVVGGALRDAAMGRPPKDIDILTDAGMDDLLDLFMGERARGVGQTFEVCWVDHIQIAPARSARDFPVGDLEKRDFTWNAMAWDPFDTETVLDPFDGRDDLANRLIRFTKDPAARIQEDPLRMVRACRFAAVLNSTLDAASRMAIRAHAGLLEKVAKERIQAEVIKAMDCPYPSVFFNTLHQTGLLDGIFPSLERCTDLDGGPHHGETVFEHCMITGDSLPRKQPLLRLAGYLHDVGKFDAAIVKEGRLSFPGHETHFKNVEQELTDLRFSSEAVAYILSMIQVHMRPLKPDTTPKAARRILAMLKAHGISYRDFMRMRIADKKGNLAKPSYTLKDIRIRLSILLREMTPDSAFAVSDLEIDGSDVMQILDIPQGPRVGEILELLFEKVLEDPGLNQKEMLKEMVRDYAASEGDQ